jgi:hypothetical protein
MRLLKLRLLRLSLLLAVQLFLASPQSRAGGEIEKVGGKVF